MGTSTGTPAFRADGTVAPSPGHVAPHPYGEPGARRPPGHSGPAVGAPAASGSQHLTVFNLAMLTLVAVASLRSLPAMATFGAASILLFVIPAVLFLVPTALVAAELATGWKGGIYTWIREAFGERWGFFAIWLQWIQNVVWYPTQLAFISASVAYVIGQRDLAANGVFVAATILILYWASTFVTLAGGNLFARLGSWGGIVGTLLPAGLLIVFGVVWLATGEPSQVPLTAPALLPPWTGVASIVLIVSNVLAYAGMEVNAVHANDLADPGRGYPRATWLSTILILLVFILPTLAIAVAVPNADLGLTSGINQAFVVYFEHWQLGWATQVISLLIALGALASVVTWIAGPSRGLLAAARQGFLPRALQRRNRAGVQVGILIPQAVLVSVLALMFVLIPNGNTAFATLIDMAAALYLVMYMLMFAAALRLRRTRPDVVRSYRTPALPVVAGVGFVMCAAAFCFAFIRPSGFTGLSVVAYPLLVGLVVILLGTPPLLLYQFRRPSWDLRDPRERVEQDVLVNPPTPPAG